jgi:hypothetical protein
LGQVVLIVVAQVEGVCAHDALGHVAVGVVPVFLHSPQVGNGVLVGGVHVGIRTHPGLAGQVAGGGIVGVGIGGVHASRATASGNGTTKMLLRY